MDAMKCEFVKHDNSGADSFLCIQISHGDEDVLQLNFVFCLSII